MGKKKKDINVVRLLIFFLQNECKESAMDLSYNQVYLSNSNKLT